MTPKGLPRVEAATYIGCSPRMFDGMVYGGSMPCPRLIGSKKVWDTAELKEAFEELPRASSGNDNTVENDWDENTD